MKRIRIASLSVLIASLSCGFVYFLLFTATGLAWYLNLNIDDPHAEIAIGDLSHTLNGQYTISGFRYRCDSLEINLDQLTIDWTPLAILSQELNIRELTGTDLSVKVNAPLHTLTENNHLAIPIATTLTNGSITGVTLILENGKQHAFAKVDVEQLFLHQDFFAEKILLSDRNGSQYNIAGRFGFNSNSVISLSTAATIKLPAKQKYLQTHGTVVGNIAQLRFMQQVSAPYSTTITGLIKTPMEEPFLELAADINTTDKLVSAPDNPGLTKLTGKLTGAGNLYDFTLNGQLYAEDRYSHQWSATLSSKFRDDQAVFQLVAQQPKSSPKTRVTVKGTLQLAQLKNEAARAVSINGNWNNLSWLLDNDTDIRSRNGNFHYDGTTQETRVKATGLKITNTGTDFRELVFTSQPDANYDMKIAGKASTANGDLSLTGYLSKTHNHYQIENLSITGNNFALVKKPQAHIIVSPNLSINRVNKTMVSKGVIKIPTANIQLQKLANTINQLTAFVGKGKLLAENEGTDIKPSSFNVELGKAVWLHGYGLNAHVTGDLAIANASDHGIIANGVLNVLRGDYNDKDKKLAVSGGRLKFAQHHLDDPELELQVASKNSNSINKNTIRGHLQRLYSNNRKDSLKPGNSLRVSKDKLALN